MQLVSEDLAPFPEEVTIGGLAMHRAVYVNGTALDIKKSHRVHRSADGFDWGYKGSGPAQLSFAILWHFLDDFPYDEEKGYLLIAETVKARFDNAVRLAEYFYRAINLVLVKHLPQMNFEIVLQLSQLMLGLAGLTKEPVSVMHLYVHNILSEGNTIAAFRYMPANREIITLPDEVLVLNEKPEEDDV